MTEYIEVSQPPIVIHLQLPQSSMNDSIQVSGQLKDSIAALGYRIPKDYQILYAPYCTPDLLYINLFTYNRGMLQDPKLRELLLEYMI